MHGFIKAHRIIIMIFGFVLQFTIVHGLNSNSIFIIHMEPRLKNGLVDTFFSKTIDVHM